MVNSAEAPLTGETRGNQLRQLTDRLFEQTEKFWTDKYLTQEIKEIAVSLAKELDIPVTVKRQVKTEPKIEFARPRLNKRRRLALRKRAEVEVVTLQD